MFFVSRAAARRRLKLVRWANETVRQIREDVDREIMLAMTCGVNGLTGTTAPAYAQDLTYETLEAALTLIGYPLNQRR